MKSITIRYGIDQLTKEFRDEATVRDIIGNTSVKAGLGFGDSVQVLCDGVALSMDSEVEDGDEIVIETACNKKAQDQKTVTIQYGVDFIEKALPYNAVIADIRRNSSIRAALGFGDNVRMLIGGVAMPDDSVIPNGAIVVVETACNTKAS
jgi:hypothetical protein